MSGSHCCITALLPPKGLHSLCHVCPLRSVLRFPSFSPQPPSHSVYRILISKPCDQRYGPRPIQQLALKAPLPPPESTSPGANLNNSSAELTNKKGPPWGRKCSVAMGNRWPVRFVLVDALSANEARLSRLRNGHLLMSIRPYL